MEPDLWGTIERNAGLALYREDQQIRTATVAWVHDTNQGLQPNELQMIVHLSQVFNNSTELVPPSSFWRLNQEIGHFDDVAAPATNADADPRLAQHL